MDKILISLVVVLAALAIATLTIVIILLARKKESVNIDDQTEQFDRIIDALSEVVTMINTDTTKGLNASKEYIVSNFNSSSNMLMSVLNPYMQKFSTEIGEISKVVEDKLKEIRVEMKDTVTIIKTEVNESLKLVREDNQKQLDAMRATVDEKLSSTLDTRVKSAFMIVNDRLDAVQKGFGEMKDLSDKVGNLNKVFTNVKTRGGWGEVALESLLEQILSPEQYARQVRLQPNSKEMVDFAVIMPGQAGETVYLPIDAKFPLSDYERLVDASEKGNVEEIVRAKKALVDCVKKEAKSISQKYVEPPYTTPFAIMYLPTEGLYAEIVRDSGLCSDLQTNQHITVCGPTTLTALLNSLQTGFTTLKIQKRSGEVINLMNAFRKDFATFTELIGKVKGKAQDMVRSLENVDRRNEIIKKKLNNVGLDDIKNPMAIEEIEGAHVGYEQGDLDEDDKTEEQNEV